MKLIGRVGIVFFIFGFASFAAEVGTKNHFLKTTQFKPGKYFLEKGDADCPGGELILHETKEGLNLTDGARFFIGSIGKSHVVVDDGDCKSEKSSTYKKGSLIFVSKEQCKGFSEIVTNIFMGFESSGKVKIKFSETAKNQEPKIYECVLGPDESGEEPKL